MNKQRLESSVAVEISTVVETKRKAHRQSYNSITLPYLVDGNNVIYNLQVSNYNDLIYEKRENKY